MHWLIELKLPHASSKSTFRNPRKEALFTPDDRTLQRPLEKASPKWDRSVSPPADSIKTGMEIGKSLAHHTPPVPLPVEGRGTRLRSRSAPPCPLNGER